VAPVEFRILGPLEVLDGERRVPLGGAKRRAVLALLLLDANQVVSTERLIDGVWGDEPPAGALASLQNHVLRLRRELGERIVTRAPGYLMRVERDELDLERFRRLVEEARTREPGEAAALLRDALALWRGTPLADLADEPVIAAAVGLEGLRLDTLERRLDAELALGRHAQLVSELETLVVEQPFRERLRAQLVLALYRSGRQGDALEAYASARAAFVDELGLEPGAELQELQRAVLRQDPALDAPASAPVTSAPAIEESRKTVTVLLADLGTDTQDPEARREELRRARADATATVEAHGGSVDESVNDRVVAIFGVPAAREDDALRGVRAACDLRAAGVVTRAAVATGNVITGDPSRGRPHVSGPPLQEADRLLAGAVDGDVLAGERTLRLVQHAVVPGAAPRSVESVLHDAEAVARRLETPLVGRADELGELLAAFQLATLHGHTRLVTVLGSPGVGKTRLARELVDVLSAAATCTVGRTPPFAEAPTYAALRDAFSSLAQGSVGPWAASVLADQSDGERVARQVAAAVGETHPGGPVEETAWAVRRLVETIAGDRPLVLVLEDLHDASPAMLDLVEHVVTLARGPILVVVLARPELLDTRPDWGGVGVRGTSIRLDVLPTERAGDLLDHLAGAPLADERREAILRAAAGNPLFLEQLLAAAAEDETVPDSIHALLAARLDRLTADDRRVLQAAAVLGHTFPTVLVQPLVDTDARQALLVLARRDFVEPDAPDPFGSESWVFRHALVREEAYATLPKRRRAQLHEQVAEIIDATTQERGIDFAEVVGYHLESAYLAAHEVDPQAPELGRLAFRAAQQLGAAGRRALVERDTSTAIPFFRRALALLPPTAPERIELSIHLADSLGWVGERDEGLRLLDETARLVRPSDERTQARVLVVRHALRLWGREPEDPASVLDDVRRAMATLEAGDHDALAFAHIVAYQAAVRISPAEQPERELMLAMEHARAAGDRGLAGLAAGWLCVHLRRGPLSVDDAKRQILGVLDDPPTQYARASALGGLADLRAMEGAFDEARRLVAENHAILEGLGLPQTEAADLIAVAEVEILAGDLDAAERLLRKSLEGLEAAGAHFGAVNAAWRLALVLVRQGRDDEAEPLLGRAGLAYGGDFVQVWRLVLGATIAARRGESERVAALLEEGDRTLEDLAETGVGVDLLLQAAEASDLIGRLDDASARLRRAVELAERLGYVVGQQAAAERLAAIEARL
jgi:DNA-binding SARP family transcriptional activator/tetratricopeptide (TPR) repeat protein